MKGPAMLKEARTLDDYVEAFESAHQERGGADLKEFLPAAEDPLHRVVLRELIRIDLEFGWESGRARSLEDYRLDFPGLFDDPESLQEIAFEEYRLRRRAGQSPSPQEYSSRYGVCTDGWPAPAEEEIGSPVSIQLEKAAHTYRAFRLAQSEPESIALESKPESIHLDWQPPSGLGQEVAKHRAPLPEPIDSAFRAAALFRHLHAANERQAEQLAESLTSMPKVGDDFLGFRLIGELGRGAFGRVFLARQAALARRPVALKVAPDVGDESQTLAQLQHTHIVPIYSVHRAGPLQAVCMPWVGGVTVADVLSDQHARNIRPEKGLDLLHLLTRKPRPRGVGPAPGPSEAIHSVLAGRSYSESVLWFGARLAEGLHHAHERGILHRDVKPANILITDEGLPMLLDFNVAEDVKQRGASEALIGGTLPYMAPESLAAFQGGKVEVDGRADVYSLGIVLFELLTGRFPFPLAHFTGSVDGTDGPLQRMLQDRRDRPPCPRRFVPGLSPATAAIVRHCLEPDSTRRYPSARALQEDIDRHLAQLPLRYAPDRSVRERLGKWYRRHPKMGLHLAAMAAALLLLASLAFGWRAMTLQRVADAKRRHASFVEKYREAQFLMSRRMEGDEKLRREGFAAGESALGLYNALEEEGWHEAPAVAALSEDEQQAVRKEAGELMIMLARLVAEDPAGNPTERAEKALAWNRRAQSAFPPGAAPESLWDQRVLLSESLGPKEYAAAVRERAEASAGAGAQDKVLKARVQVSARRYREAIELLEPVLQDEPNHFWASFLLGMCNDGLGRNQQSINCYTTCVALTPRFSAPYINRGLAYLRAKQFAKAKADFDVVLRLLPTRAETYLDRALARDALGDHRGAIDDLNLALKHHLGATRVYFLRSRIREVIGDKKGARSDREEGLKQKPTDEKSWIARGYARMVAEPDEALADFDEALKLNPESIPALMNKAHILVQDRRKRVAMGRASSRASQSEGNLTSVRP
jgi:serine/threonine protein kinase/tetratricopeptide (TPR) repeat protein